MAYQALSITVTCSYGCKIDVCENKNGFLFYREHFCNSFTGSPKAGKWTPLSGVAWNERGQLDSDLGILCTIDTLKDHYFDVSFRIPADGGICKLPEFQRVLNEPKVLGIECGYCESNGAYEIAYIRDKYGRIHSCSNVYNQKHCYRNMSDSDLFGLFGIELVDVKCCAAENRKPLPVGYRQIKGDSTMKLKAINCKNMGAILVHQQKPDGAPTDLVAEVHSGFEDAQHIAECVNAADAAVKREEWPEDVAENLDPTAIQGGVVVKPVEAAANREGKTRSVTVRQLTEPMEQRDALLETLEKIANVETSGGHISATWTLLEVKHLAQAAVDSVKGGAE